MPDPIFDPLFRQTGQLAWSSPADVARRGRQLHRRRLALVTAAVLALTLGTVGGVFAATGQHRESLPPPADTPTVPPPSRFTAPTVPPTLRPSDSASTPVSQTSPSATDPTPIEPVEPVGPEIPDAALLQVSDLPAGARLLGTDIDGDWSFAAVAANCAAPPNWGAAAPLAERGRNFATAGDEKSTLQRVQRYAGADAAADYVAAVGTAAGCRLGRPNASLGVVAEGVAGAQSLIVQSEIEGYGSAWVFVRQGDLVAEVWPGARTDRTELRRLALRTAERLCAGTDAC